MLEFGVGRSRNQSVAEVRLWDRHRDEDQQIRGPTTTKKKKLSPLP
jgi:hypothetical protein